MSTQLNSTWNFVFAWPLRTLNEIDYIHIRVWKVWHTRSTTSCHYHWPKQSKSADAGSSFGGSGLLTGSGWATLAEPPLADLLDACKINQQILHYTSCFTTAVIQLLLSKPLSWTKCHLLHIQQMAALTTTVLMMRGCDPIFKGNDKRVIRQNRTIRGLAFIPVLIPPSSLSRTELAIA